MPGRSPQYSRDEVRLDADFALRVEAVLLTADSGRQLNFIAHSQKVMVDMIMLAFLLCLLLHVLQQANFPFDGLAFHIVEDIPFLPREWPHPDQRGYYYLREKWFFDIY